MSREARLSCSIEARLRVGCAGTGIGTGTGRDTRLVGVYDRL